jgi:replicative DNA helicase
MRIQPNDISAEKTVLASIIINGKIFSEVYDRFKKGLFYTTSHKLIADAITRVYSNNVTIDIITISDELKKREELDKVGGDGYLCELTENIATTANVSAHLDILESKYLLRESIIRANKIMDNSYSSDATGIEVVTMAEGLYNKLAYDSFETHKEYDHHKSVHEYLKRIEDAKINKRTIRGYTSNMPDLDKMISGWEKGKVYLISGLEKLGKSRFVRSLVSHWLGDNHGVSMFMLEEDETAIHECILANRCTINTDVLETVNMTHENIVKVFEEANLRYMNDPLFISIKSGTDPMYIKTMIQRQKSKLKKQGKELIFVVVDYLQRMSGEGEGHAKMEYIASKLADITRDENVCMLEISQMSAAAEKTRGVPLHTQLRYGKAFKEAANCIITFDDPERMGKKEDDGFYVDEGCKTLMAHIIQRKGLSNITMPIRAQLQYSKFNDSVKGSDEF